MTPLPVVADVGFMFLFAFAGMLYGRGLYARGVRLTLKTDAREARLLAVVGLLCIFVNFTFLVVKNYPKIIWYMPAAVEYYCIPACWLFVIATSAILFGAVAYMGLRQRRGTIWALALACVLVLGAGEYLVQNSSWFKKPNLEFDKVDPDGMIRQSHASTCASASCANIAGRLGIPKTEREMVDLLGTTEEGTTASQIVYGMARLGFTCTKRHVRDCDFTRVNAPAVLLVAYGTEPMAHAVAYMGQKDGKAEVWNPVAGKSFMTRAQLAEVWLGHAIEVAR